MPDGENPTPGAAASEQTGATTEATSTETAATTENTESTAADQSTEGTEQSAESFDEARAMALIKKLQGIEKTLGKENAALKSKVDEAEKAKLSTEDRLRRELDEARAEQTKVQAEIAELRLGSEAAKAGAKLRIVDVDAALKLMDRNALTYGDDGRPNNLEEILGELVTARPWLAKAAEATPAAGATNGQTRSRTGLTMDVINKMSPSEMADRLDEVKAFLKARGAA